MIFSRKNFLSNTILLSIFCAAVGELVFLDGCRFIADLYGGDYAFVAVCIFLILLVVIGGVLYRVDASVVTETHYKNDMTPLKSIGVVVLSLAVLFFVMASAVKKDKENKIWQMLQPKVTEKREKVSNNINQRKEKENEGKNEIVDSPANNGAGGLRYRD